MKIRPTQIFLLILLLILPTYSLHLEQQQITQLQRLKQQQQQIRNQVNQLLTESNSIRTQIQQTKEYSQKVHILEDLIKNQKLKIFNLKNQLIYPFNQSQTACNQLTEKQKNNLIIQVQNSKKKFYDLQNISNLLNNNLTQIQQIQAQILKQLILLKQLQKILNVKCKKNISPTIFQSNLNAKNWILGPQTMQNIQDQYTQRALTFHNITNCPLDTPFYTPSSQICVKCIEPTPLFDMYSKQCTKCEVEQIFDSITKKCKPLPHYTNFTKVTNWNSGGAVLPVVDPKLTPCPDDTPYFNGVICTKCSIPKYWDVSLNICKKCQSGYQFDLNTKKCQKVVPYQLTVLQNTKWTTQNITKVIEQRIKVLKVQQTNANPYEYCPITTPYYDGTICISCDYFNIDTKKCAPLPPNTQYNTNMRKFLTLQQAKQTNIMNTQKYIISKSLANTSATNCNLTHPFYDDIACIQCVKPFDIYSVDDKKCTACNPDEIYANNNHTCQKRSIIYISQNFSKLLVTSNVTVPVYKNSLLKKINDNPDSIISSCAKNQYSNFSNCFPCQQNEYFNIQFLKCMNCDGIFNQSTLTCKEKVYIFTNLKAGNLTDMEGKTIQNETKIINEFIQTHKTSYICPLDKPYSIDDKVCGVCPQLFSYSTKKCSQCSENLIYLVEERKCAQATMIVNFSNSTRILVNHQQKLASFKLSEQQVINQNPKTFKICPADKPFTENRQFCFNCTQSSPYFNYTLKQCQKCPQNYVFDARSVQCIQQYYITLLNNQSTPKMLGYDNYTLGLYKSELQNYKKSYPYKNCTENQPFGTISGCQQCQDFFDIKKKECSNAKYLINYQKISPDYLISTANNLDFYVAEEQKYRKQSNELTTLCPADKPYTQDRNGCFNCNLPEYFNIATRKCQKCPEGSSYLRDTKSCKQLFYITKFTLSSEPKMKGYSNYTLINFKTDQNTIKLNNPFQQCNQTQPFGTGSGCVNCEQSTPYFDIKKKLCSNAKKLINFTAITTNYTLPEGENISKYLNNENNYKNYSESLTAECPNTMPYTQNRDSCFSCQQPNYLFNFETKQCQSCPKGSKYILEKKKCAILAYLTNINPESQPKMIGTNNYTVQNFKADQAKLKAENPYQNCPISDPFGTVNECRKCSPPEEYFNIKNRVCTRLRRLMNFNTTTPIITKQGKTITDYKNDENYYLSSITQPSITCPIDQPFTSDHDLCFSCPSPQVFNLESKNCQNCPQGQSFDKISNKCIKRQFYSLFTNSTQKNLLLTDKYTIEQYKTDQAKLKAASLSQECTLDKPYAIQTGCVACNSTNPYFNIEQRICTSCSIDKKFFQAEHKCLTAVYVTDLTNKNVKLDKYTIDQAAAQQNASIPAGSVIIKCPSTTPFATATGCIGCPDSKLPYFNLKTRSCENCRQLYQYFQKNVCKDNIMLTNTKSMIGYLQTDNYTRYNIEKTNNVTYLQNTHVVDCPANQPFYNDQECIACASDRPIFNLLTKICVKVEFIRKTNLQAMKFYIEKGDETLAAKQNQITALIGKGVKIQYCPSTIPYLSGNVCINCPTIAQYFNLATLQCQTCDSGQICKQTSYI